MDVTLTGTARPKSRDNFYMSVTVNIYDHMCVSVIIIKRKRERERERERERLTKSEEETEEIVIFCDDQSFVLLLFTATHE